MPYTAQKENGKSSRPYSISGRGFTCHQYRDTRLANPSREKADVSLWGPVRLILLYKFADRLPSGRHNAFAGPRTSFPRRARPCVQMIVALTSSRPGNSRAVRMPQFALPFFRLVSGAFCVSPYTAVPLSLHYRFLTFLFKWFLRCSVLKDSGAGGESRVGVRRTGHGRTILGDTSSNLRLIGLALMTSSRENSARYNLCIAAFSSR